VNHSATKPRKGARKALIYIRRNFILYAMLLLPITYYLLFKYTPMYGITIAFKDFSIFRGALGSPWVGLKYFKMIFSMPEFYRVLRNTLMLNLLDLLLSFPAPIVLAILLSEMRSMRVKKISQTIIYLPYFISWVVIAGIVLQLFAPDSGLVNILIRRLGGESLPFLTEGIPWIFTYIMVGIWQGAGWGSILYVATISGINPELYEAAIVDGAGRLRCIWHITLPGIRPTVVMMLIMRLGSMLSIGFERPYLIGNTMVREYSDVISTFVYRMGIEASNFSLATAVGLFQSAVGMVLLIVSNTIANRVNDSGIF
jgi:putative aldouronate transport system permease protein